MNQGEFTTWIGHHDAAFNGFRDWINRAERETLDKRLQMWVSRLERVPLPSATKATEFMFNSGFDQPYTKHLGYVVQWHTRHNPERDLRRFNTCDLCNNTGIVSVRFFDDQLTIGGNRLPGNIGQAACRCSCGNHVNACRSKDTHPDATKFYTFDPAKMELWNNPFKGRLTPTEAVANLRRRGNLRLAKVVEGLGL